MNNATTGWAIGMAIGLAISTFPLAAQMSEKQTGEKQSSDKMSISFRDPSRPGTVKFNINYGSIVVRAHSGKDVSVESETHAEKDRDGAVPESARGLKRLNATGSSTTLDEDNNVVTISTGWKARNETFIILVPVRTSLKLSAVNGKRIAVEGVEGEMELNATNGTIELTDVSGSVVAHALNGKIVAKFKRVDTDKPMSFSSMNGTIDVTFPSALKANLKIQTNNGDVFTDFDVVMERDSIRQEKTVPKPGEAGRNRFKRETFTSGAVNGGGPDYTFKNFNGNIYIRKGN